MGPQIGYVVRAEDHYTGTVARENDLSYTVSLWSRVNRWDGGVNALSGISTSRPGSVSRACASARAGITRSGSAHLCAPGTNDTFMLGSRTAHRWDQAARRQRHEPSSDWHRGAARPLECRSLENPDLVLTPAERDSILKQYDQIFPIWGRKAIERGFDMPTPLGFNVGWFGATQDIVISDLAIGFTNAPAEPASFIKFEKARIEEINNWNARTDLWVFPFLNVYLMVGTGDGHTTVHVSEPVKFTTTADFKGSNIGLGLTGAFGFRRSFVVGDFNHQWGVLEPARKSSAGRTYSARDWAAHFGSVSGPSSMKATAWVGTMFQNMQERYCRIHQALRRSFRQERIPCSTTIESSAWYQALNARESARRQLRWTASRAGSTQAS